MNIIICMCVYNNESGLRDVFRNIRLLKPMFNELRIIVAYSPSHDQSLSILMNNAEDALSIEIIHVDVIPNVNKTRNISNARNALLQKINNAAGKIWDLAVIEDDSKLKIIDKKFVEYDDSIKVFQIDVGATNKFIKSISFT